MKKLFLILFFLLFSAPAWATVQTWYVRSDGGNAAQCTGLTDHALAGATGTSCAFNDVFLVTGWNGGDSARWAGGDTLIVGDPGGSPGSFAIGWITGRAGCTQGSGADCRILNIPSGIDSNNPTNIFGRQHGSCTTTTQLYGTAGVYWMFNIDGRDNIRFECLDVTDKENCGESLTGVACPGGSGNWGRDGFRAYNSSNVYFKDMKIRGFAHNGFAVGKLNNWTFDNTWIDFNAWANFENAHPDHGPAENANTGPIYFIDSKARYAGCTDDYPNYTPYKCFDQTANGYGDNLTGGSADQNQDIFIINTEVSHATSDGLDWLYYNGHGTLYVTRSSIKGNNGNQIKTGSNLKVENSIVYGNCGYFFGKSYVAAGWQSYGYCRSGGETIVFDVSNGDHPNNTGNHADIDNSTIIGSGNYVLYTKGDICNGTEYFRVRNSIVEGLINWNDQTRQTDLYGEEGGCTSTFSNDIDYSYVFKSLNSPCPLNHIYCADPLLSSTPPNNAIDDFTDLTLTSGSPAIGKADASITMSSYGSNDFTNASRGTTWDIGAYEFAGAGPTCGDNSCNGFETCSHTVAQGNDCEADCGICAPVCGQYGCETAKGEDCNTCPPDCNICAPTCGDGVCNGTETNQLCGQDCPISHGDGYCNPAGETCNNSPVDCGLCPVSSGGSTAHGKPYGHLE